MGKRIQLWYLIGNLGVGGTERTLVDLANALDPDRFDVTIWTLENHHPLGAQLDESVKLRSLDAAAKWDLRVPVKFARAVRRSNPDIFQSFLFYDNIFTVLFGSLSKSTVITGVREVPNEPNTVRNTVRRLVHPRADYVVSNSKSGAQFIINSGVDPSKITVIHNGRGLDSYANGNATDELYHELGVERDQPIIGTVGRLVERKGHFDLIDAWSKVFDSHPDAQLLIVGEGPEYEQLRKKCLEVGYAKSIHLLGRRDDIPQILDLLDVFVFPSHYEGFPGALLEAMAAGLPIVTTPVDGNKELITDGEQGIHVPPHSPTALADALNTLLRNGDRATLLGKQAKERAFSQFTLEQMVSEFEDLYEEVTQLK